MSESQVVESTGNVFEDIGLPYPDHVLAKAQMVSPICELVAEQGLTRLDAATLLGVDRRTMSDLTHGRLARFSFDGLFRFLNSLGAEIEVIIHPKRKDADRGHVRVVVPG